MDRMEIGATFAGRRVLVTGDTGFKGSWLALWLQQMGAEVWGYALPARVKEEHFNAIGLDNLIHHVDGDIRDQESFQKTVVEARPEFLFHLAAQPLVRYSYENPKLTFDTNIAGSVNILEAVRTSATLRVLVYVTSDKCYLNKEWIWGYRENDELGGNDPYSASKAGAEIVFASYLASFFQFKPQLGAASVRAGNVIGGGDWAEDRIVPDCIKALRENKPIILRNPASTRPWQHVLESLSGYLLLAAKLYADPRRYSGPWNFGPAPEAVHTTRELADKIVAHWGAGQIHEEKQTGAPKEARQLKLNCDKAHVALQWRPRWNFERTVAETVGWYKQVTQGAAPLKVSQQQLQSFLQAPV